MDERERETVVVGLASTVRSNERPPAPRRSRAELVSTAHRYLHIERLEEVGLLTKIRAYDLRLRREVDLVRVRASPDRSRAEELPSRALGRASALATVFHPAVASVFETWSTIDELWIATEPERGPRAPQWLEFHERAEASVLAAMLARMASAVAALRARFDEPIALQLADFVVEPDETVRWVPRTSWFTEPVSEQTVSDEVRLLLVRTLERSAKTRRRLLRELECADISTWPTRLEPFTRARRRSWISTGLALAVSVGAGLMTAEQLRAPVCRDRVEALDAIWTSSREEMIAALEPASARAFTRYARAWPEATAHVCESVPRHSSTFDRALLCLDRRLLAFDAALGVLEASDSPPPVVAEKLGQGLIEPAHCFSKRAADEAPRAAGNEDEVRRLEAQLLRGQAEIVASNLEAVRAIGDSVLARARVLGDDRLTGRALILRGRGHGMSSDTVAARADLLEGVSLSLEQGDWENASIGVTELAMVAHDRSHSAEALAWGRLGTALARRPGVQTQVRLRAHSNHASILSVWGGVDDAVSELEEVLKGQTELFGSMSEPVGRTLDNLGIMARRQGRLLDAESLQRRALKVLRRELGPDHPDVAMAHCNLGNTLAALERLEEAQKHLRVGMTGLQRGLSPEHAFVGIASVNLADVLLASNQRPEALELYDRAIGIFAGTDEPDWGRAGFTAVKAARLEMEDGAWMRALARLTLAIPALERVGGPYTESAESARTMLATVTRELGAGSG